MFPRVLSLLQSLLLASFALSQNWTANPFVPPAVPLAIKSPYVQTWMRQGKAEGSLDSGWASFRDKSIIAWAGKVKVNDKFCDYSGPANPPAVQKDMTFTATKTVFTLTCGSVDITATYLSPIEPTDLVNQSIPFSYLSVEAASNDGSPHQVQLYTDVTGEWLAQSDQLLQWQTLTGNTFSHTFWLQNQTKFTEVGGRIRDGSMMYSTKQVNGMTWQVGEAAVLRALFQTNGALNNSADLQFRAISDRWPVFAYAHDLGTVGTTKSTPVVYAIGLVRDTLVQIQNLQNVNSMRSPYYATRYGSVPGMVSVLLDDYPNMLARANAFDSKLASDALAITPQNSDYANILALSARQLFGAIEITSGWDGTTQISTDIMAFMRTSMYTNMVDMIYAAWPAFLYTNPAIGRYLLEPVLVYQAANPTAGGYAVHDIGDSYPGIKGPSSESYPVEESGNQLIMALSYTQATSDNSFIAKYKTLYDQFATYLVQNGLYITSQVSSDSYAGPLANQTNLAVKSIVAIKAASEIFRILGDTDKSQQYNNVANSYLQTWQNVALSSDKSHYTLSYGNNPSWGLLYNLYADRLLGFNMFPQTVYETQTNWYSGKLSDYGIQLDTRSTDAKTDWQIWTAATLTNGTVRSNMIQRVKGFTSSRINDGPFPDRYNCQNGQMVDFEDRPVVGGHFALLLVPNVVGTNSSSGGGSGSNGGKGGNSAETISPTPKMALMSFVALLYMLS